MSTLNNPTTTIPDATLGSAVDRVERVEKRSLQARLGETFRRYWYLGFTCESAYHSSLRVTRDARRDEKLNGMMMIVVVVVTSTGQLSEDLESMSSSSSQYKNRLIAFLSTIKPQNIILRGTAS
jgi:hypothetical protein